LGLYPGFAPDTLRAIGLMSAKTSARRRDAFLTALAQTGNQTLSAERAKVSRSWVTFHRSTEPGFDAACRAAIDAARDALRAAAGDDPSTGAGRAVSGCKPATGLTYLDGIELVVRGTGGAALGPRPGGGLRVQVARARTRQWSPRAEERFLTALTATCNVKAACAEVGLSPASAYNHRLRWPRFAERWKAAVEIGYCQLEFALIEAGCNLLSGEGVPEVAPLTGMTFSQAIHLLQMHKHAVRQLGRRPGQPQRPEDIEVVRAEVIRRLAIYQRQAALDAACQGGR
jgi:hypothetical protein